MNSFNGIGRICKDLELKTTNSNTAYCKFSLAVDRKFKKEGQASADFLNCIAWGKTAELITNYLGKGSKIGVQARVETGSYDGKDGNKVYTTDFVIESVTFCESKGQGKGDAHEPNSSNNSNSSQGGFYPVEDDEELPF